MLIDKLPGYREEKRQITVSKERFSKSYEGVLVLDDNHRYIIVTSDSDCYLGLLNSAYINSRIRVNILGYRKNRLNLNSQLKVLEINYKKGTAS